MTCSEAQEAMLDVELADLRGDGTSAISEHLRTCLPCRRAAAAIVADTNVLAQVAQHERRVRSTGRRTAIAGLAAAGIVVAFAVRAIGPWESRPALVRPLAPPVPHAAAIRSADPPDSATRSSVASGIERVAPRHVHVPASRIRAVAIQPAAFVAVPIQAAEPAVAEDETPVVSVSPHGGRRAAVFRIADSNVTVVWLY